MLDFSYIYIFTWELLWSEEFEIEMAIDAMKTSINNQEESWLSIRKKFEKIVENDPTLNSLDEELQGSYYSQFFEMESRTIDEIKRFQRKSMFLTIFAFFEGRLKNICEKIEKNNTLTKKIIDIKGRSDIEKLWKFLTTVYKIEVDKAEPYFNLIECHKFARNRIAHHEGYITENHKNRITLVNGLEIKGNAGFYYVEISNKSFLIYLLDNIAIFYKELLFSIDKRHKELKG